MKNTDASIYDDQVLDSLIESANPRPTDEDDPIVPPGKSLDFTEESPRPTDEDDPIIPPGKSL